MIITCILKTPNQVLIPGIINSIYSLNAFSQDWTQGHMVPDTEEPICRLGEETRRRSNIVPAMTEIGTGAWRVQGAATTLKRLGCPPVFRLNTCSFTLSQYGKLDSFD